ncbi:MAG TPA: TonB-dependent receptor [Sphingomicrobium sp.]|nr:TonB-dependent receptor [Sphingomicrobium sp.]
MTKRRLKSLAFGLLASTAIASPAFAQTQPVEDTTQSPAPGTNATQVTGETPQEQTARDGEVPDSTEIIITAQKREENLQDVPISVQAIGTRRLDQLNISNFEDYTKQLPSVSFQTAAPGFTTVYMRGVASGGDGNHSGSLPSVGSYLDEQPITTIGGTLDVHIYDIARIESLAGPQGTLYGASSQAGTIRIITNKPELGVTTGRIDGELNTVAHGGVGGSLEGMINLPIADNIAFRGVAFYQRDAGYIDNVFGERTYCGTVIEGPDGDDDDALPDVIGCNRDGIHVDNAAFVKKNFNTQRVYGGRAALKIDLDENWTITPTIMHQNSRTKGVFYEDARLGDLEVQRFREEPGRDKFTQYALTVEGKIADFDVTYAGAYMHRPNSGISDYTDYADAYDAYYESYGGLANYFAFEDAEGNTIDPRQYIKGSNNFKKLSQEIRFSTPQDWRGRAIVGAFYQRQTNDIYQNYLVDNLAPDLSVNGWPGTLWLTLQERVDKDFAIFGEGEFDLSPKITLIAGGRYFKFNNSLFGFAGFGKNPNFSEDEDDPGNDLAPNAAFGSSGVRRCLTVNGLQAIDDPDAPLATGGIGHGIPCTNVGNVVNGKLVPRRSKGDGFIHRVGAQYKPVEDIMFYATWSRGFRPGGINRQPNAGAYDPDYLTNYELGWKTGFGPIRWNGAIYHQVWEKFQFSFLGENSLTVIQNGRDARINGIETDVNYTQGGWTFNAAASYTDAKTKDNICNDVRDDAPDCSTLFINDPTDDEDDEQDFILAPKGTRLPVTPKFKIAGSVRYAWPVGPGRAHLQAGIAHQGSAGVDLRQDLDGDPDVVVNPNDALGRIKGSTLVDLFAGYEWNKMSFELFATNVFDERNQLSRFVVCGDNCIRPEFVKVVPGRPRTIGLRVGTRF